jgi:hypothetical protein
MTQRDPAFLPKLRQLASLQQEQARASSFPIFHTNTFNLPTCPHHHPVTGAARAHLDPSQNHQEDFVGRTKARAPTTTSAATLTAVTAMTTALHHRAVTRTVIDTVVARPDLTTTVTATDPHLPDVMKPTVPETEGGRLDVTDPEGTMILGRRDKETGPRTKKKRKRSPRSLPLLHLPSP